MRKGFPTSSRLGWPAACSALALLAAGCGGAPAPKQAAQPPRIPRETASALAGRADAVAAALDRGDACAAHSDASALSSMAASAEVAPVFHLKLVQAVRELSAALPPCTPPPPPPPPPPPQRPAKHHDKHKHGERRHGGHQQGEGGD